MKKQIQTSNQVYFYRDTPVLFVRHLSPTKALVEALHRRGRIFWTVNPQELEVKM